MEYKLSKKILDVEEFDVVGRGKVIWTRREYVGGIKENDVIDLDGKKYQARSFELISHGDFGLGDHIGILVRNFAPVV